jgi:hypothetical protein
LDRLRLYFEATLAGNDFNPEITACLSTSFTYRELLLAEVLSETNMERGSLHSVFTPLLARNLKFYSGYEKVRRVKEIITMLWASPVDRGPWATGNLIRKYGMENFFDANMTQVMVWIVNAEEISHIGEILEHLPWRKSTNQISARYGECRLPRRIVTPTLSRRCENSI